MATNFTTNGIHGFYATTLLGVTTTYGFIRTRTQPETKYDNSTNKGYLTIQNLITLMEVGMINGTSYTTHQEFSDLINQLFG